MRKATGIIPNISDRVVNWDHLQDLKDDNWKLLRCPIWLRTSDLGHAHSDSLVAILPHMTIPFIVVQYDLYNHFCWLNNFGYRHDWMSMLCQSLSHLRYWDHHPISMFEHQKTNVYICLPPKWFLLYGKTKTVYQHDRNIFPGNSPRPSVSCRSRRSLPWTPSSWAAMGQLSHGKHMENVWKTYRNVYICIYGK